MALPCIDLVVADELKGIHPERILYVTKEPPSDSGIARHSVEFRMALSELGKVKVFGLSMDSKGSQRLVVTIITLFRVIAAVVRWHPQLIVVDLSGRALAEFYSSHAVACLPRRWRPRLWLTLHDVPSLVGSPLLFSILDRRGCRRVGVFLSRLAGPRLEHRLIRRADLVVALSRTGASRIASEFPAARVRYVPIVNRAIDSHGKKRRVIYCPSGSSVDSVVQVVRMLASEVIPDDFELHVGPGSEQAELVVRRLAAELGVSHRVRHTGLLSQEGLDREFVESSIVLRVRDTEAMANSSAASGVLISALAAGCAVVAVGAAGSTDCLAAAGQMYDGVRGSWREELCRLCADDALLRERSSAAAGHVEREHSPAVVSNLLRGAWRDSCQR